MHDDRRIREFSNPMRYHLGMLAMVSGVIAMDASTCKNNVERAAWQQRDVQQEYSLQHLIREKRASENRWERAEISLNSV